MTNYRNLTNIVAVVALLASALSGCSSPPDRSSANDVNSSSSGTSTPSSVGGNAPNIDIREVLVEKLAQHCPDISGFASTASSWIVDASTTSAPYYVYLNGDGGAVVLWFSPDSSARPFEVDAEYAETTNLLLSYANCDFTEAVEETPTESEEETVSGHYEERCFRGWESGRYDINGDYIEGYWYDDCTDVWVVD
jgi:hypothetical protein